MSNPVGRPKGSFTHIHPARRNGKVTKEYSAWQAMIQRCTNPKAHNWKWYGGKGIEVCDRWRGPQGYNNFIMDMGLSPPGLTLDRRNNALGYEPGNCRWATWKEQASNRAQGGRKNIRPGSLRQRALAAGLPYHMVYFRIHRLGWPEAQALSVPHLGRGKPVGGWRRDV